MPLATRKSAKDTSAKTKSLGGSPARQGSMATQQMTTLTSTRRPPPSCRPLIIDGCPVQGLVTVAQARKALTAAHRLPITSSAWDRAMTNREPLNPVIADERNYNPEARDIPGPPRHPDNVPTAAA